MFRIAFAISGVIAYFLGMNESLAPDWRVAFLYYALFVGFSFFIGVLFWLSIKFPIDGWFPATRTRGLFSFFDDIWWW